MAYHRYAFRSPRARPDASASPRLCVVQDRYHVDAVRVWTDAEDGACVERTQKLRQGPDCHHSAPVFGHFFLCNACLCNCDRGEKRLCVGEGN